MEGDEHRHDCAAAAIAAVWSRRTRRSFGFVQDVVNYLSTATFCLRFQQNLHCRQRSTNPSSYNMGLFSKTQDFIKSRLGSLLIAISILLGVVQYCWLAENTSLFEKTTKSFSSIEMFMCVSVCVWGALRFQSGKIEPSDSILVNTKPRLPFLPREQTEEWKGWMQAVILLYHYSGMSANLYIYQMIRVLVAAYIFLTGYSHTTYFLTTDDFSMNRTMKMLLRLNLLSCILAYAMNKSWDFYYFPTLTSFWYLVILITMRCSRTPSGNFSHTRLYICYTIACVLVHILLYSEIGKNACFLFLTKLSTIGGPQVNPRELNFRLKLDSLMPYWGAALAILVKANDREFRQFAQLLRPEFYLHFVSCWIIIVYFLAIQGFKDKVTSNAWHPLISIFPIAATLAFRNAMPRWRGRFNPIFRWLGSISLETYVLQSHIWLTNNNKGLLRLNLVRLLHVDPDGALAAITVLVDRLVITAVFLIVSHLTAHTTKVIIDWLVSGSKAKTVGLVLLCWVSNLLWNKLI